MSLTTAFISHQIWLQRYASHEAAQFQPAVQDMRNAVRAAVLGMGDDGREKARLIKMLRDLEDALYGITSDFDDQLLKDLQDLSIYESEWTVRTLADNIAANFTTPTPEQVWSAVKFNPLALDNRPVDFQRLLSSWGDVEVNRLVTGVKMGFVQGQTTRKIVQQVIGEGGLADISARNVATMVRTSINHVSTQAKATTYEKNSDVVKGYELVVTLDSRTSAICRGWPPGKVYKPTDKFRPEPPFHPNCRTTTAPVVSSEFDFLDKGAKRAANGADGGTQVDANTSYYDFLKAQPAWFQDKALGPVRGSIFRNAGMTPEEFRAASVDGFGRPLTLSQMAEADDRVAKYLNED